MKILASSDRHAAIGNIAEKANRRIQLRRYGEEDTVRERYHQIDRASLLCTTNMSAVKDDLANYMFPRVLQDEAAQSFECSSLMPLVRGCEQLVMLGDDKQLPPRVEDAALEYDAGTSLLEKILSSKVACTMLDVQYIGCNL